MRTPPGLGEVGSTALFIAEASDFWVALYERWICGLADGRIKCYARSVHPRTQPLALRPPNLSTLHIGGNNSTWTH